MTIKKPSATAKKRLGRLIKDCIDHGFRKRLLEEAGGEDEAHALLWEAVALDAVYVGRFELSRFLVERALTEQRAAILAEHLARHRPEETVQYLPRWCPDVDTLVYRALPLAQAAFAASEPSYDEWAKLGLAFVRRRRGETIPIGQAEQIVTELARNTARGKLLGYIDNLPTPSVDGADDPLLLQSTADVRRLAETMAPDGGARFDEALAEATRENAWREIRDVEPVLRAMPRSELLGQMVVSTYRMDEALALFEARLAAKADTPGELFAEARRLALEVAERGVERGDPMLLAMVLVVSGARQVEGAEVPSELEDIVTFARVAQYSELRDALIAVLGSMPAARVHAWVESVIESDGAAALALAAHYDEDQLSKLLFGSAPVVVQALGPLGARAIPLLTKAINESSVDRAARLRHALVFALDTATTGAAPCNEPPPEDLDVELLVAAFEGRPMEREAYGNALRAATERIVVAMPAERRKQILTAAYEAAPMSMISMLHAISDDAELTAYLATAIVDGMVTDWMLKGLGARAVPALLACGGRGNRTAWVREQAEMGLPPEELAKIAHVFLGGEKWRALETEVAAATALDPDAQRVRVYLLERATAATPARVGSMSRLGGPSNDDELAHIITVDLDDAPELRAHYPRAKAIALYTPRPECGSVEDSRVVPLSLAEVKSGARHGAPLAVFGIDVSLEVFAAPATLEPALRAVQDRIWHAGGHVLGRPFWVNGNPFNGGDGDNFIMQINDWLNEDLNLSDGSVYVYEDAVLVQAL